VLAQCIVKVVGDQANEIYFDINTFNGAHEIESVSSDVELVFTLRQPPSPAPPGFHEWLPGEEILPDKASLGVPYFALSADNGVAAVVEGNRVYNCSTGGPYHDTGSTKDLTIRDNYYHNVYFGPVQNMGLISQAAGRDTPARPAENLTRGGSGNRTATLATPQLAPHGLSVGEAVVIANAFVGGHASEYFNGHFYVAQVLSGTQFTYVMKGDPGGDADASPAPLFGRLWQLGRVAIENNVIELMRSLSDAHYQPRAIDIGVNFPPFWVDPYVFRHVVVRGNLIRMADSQGCIKLVMGNGTTGRSRFLSVHFDEGEVWVKRRMPSQRLNWFSSVQSREVAWRLGRPLAHRCLKALERRRNSPRTDAALGWRTRLSSSRRVTSRG
jgi:hypothetical protein